ncbi:hypothetical protein FV113G1_12870 [Fusobacterium varium]|nr:hypothetical protein FV113G1_12870 [Fusobacterium varium]
MSIIKVVKKSGKTFASLKKVLSYVGKKASETFGLNCNNNFKNVAKEFIETKKFFNKEEGRQYRHYIQSFKPGEITKEKIMELSIKWTEKVFPGHEVFIAVHNDKEHLHTHFIVNSVNFETGKKLHENRNNLDMKKKINDEICLEYGINNKQELKKEGEIITYDKNKYQIIKKGADITRLAESLLNVIQVATSKKDFSNKMKNYGYEVEWNENKTHIVFSADPSILKGKKNKFRLANLQKIFNISDFSKERLLEIFEENSRQSELKKLDEIAKNMMFDEVYKREKEIKTLNSISKPKITSKKSWRNKNTSSEIDFK